MESSDIVSALIASTAESILPKVQQRTDRFLLILVIQPSLHISIILLH